MRELRSGVRRGRSATKAAIEEVERSLADQGSATVIRRTRSSIKNNKQKPEVEQPQHDVRKSVQFTLRMVLDEEKDSGLETKGFDEIRENVVEIEDYHDAEENMETCNAPAAEELEEEEEANRTPTPYEEPTLLRTRLELHARSAVAQIALTAKKRYLEKGLRRQTLLHESSSSYEMDGETREGSVPLAAPECEVTDHNCEMYDHKHKGSVPIDIPECETAKDVVVDSNNSKQKKKDKVAPTSKEAPVGIAEDEMHRTTRLLGKRKASGTIAEQPNMEDHLIEAPEEFELRGAEKLVSQRTFFQKPKRLGLALKIADKLQEQRMLMENKRQEERMSCLRVEDQLLNPQNKVSRLEETLANIMQSKPKRQALKIADKLHEQRQALKIADKLHEQQKLIENKWQEERLSRLRMEDQLLNTQNTVSRLEHMLANFMQNGKAPTSISNKHPSKNCGNSRKDLASVSTMLPTNNNENLGVEPASTSTLVPVYNNGNLGKRVTSASNRVPKNNIEYSGKGPALTSSRVPISNKEKLGKGPASTSTRVHLKKNESLGNFPASFSDRDNSNNYEPSTSGRSQSMIWRNDEENLPVVQVNPSRHVARSVKDSNVSRFQRFYNSASQRLTGSIPFISVPVDAAVFGTEMELYLELDDVRYMCHMEDLSENCVVAYIRNLYDILAERGIQHKYEFINPASVKAAKDADLSKIITSRLMNTTCEWVFIPVNPEGAHWLLVAINMVAMSCYWLDPSGLPARFNIKPFVTFGLKGLQKDGVKRSSPIWYNVKCPKQKHSMESGFYIMKFMREIIDEPNMFTKSEPFSKSTYEQDEIDEVRLEWIQTIEAYL
ncbi:uncharacterized protein LOC113355759 isoform X2 [Papaver somniferum]|uniref:uncharacterized protein LOC113355759 isoform X2 n=1 Tax=Papaver somniferum TaxID=3469 RepID=UPI000E7056A5|nr:uncharacterized protein LOC113355759 isoform X2 [Papaver somniferum]